MKKNLINNAINEIDIKYIDEYYKKKADNTKKKIGRSVIFKWCAVASIAAAIILAVIFIPQNKTPAARGEYFCGNFFLNEREDGVDLLKYCGTDEKIVEIPEGVTTIYSGAFADNETVEKIIIPDSVETINALSFMNCPNLTEIDIPSSVENVFDSSFFNVAFIESCEDEFVIAGSVLVKYKGNGGDVVIPEGVKTILSTAFVTGNINEVLRPIATINTLTLPSSLEKIGQEAFFSFGISGELVIPENVKEIGSNAFFGNDFSSVIINSPYVEIGDRAFDSCDNIQKVVLNENIKKLPECAFSSRVLSEINAENLEEIGYRAFQTKSLVKLNFGSVKYLSDFDIDSVEITGISCTNGFWVKGNVLVRYIGNEKNIVVPDGVEIIGDYAFANTRIESVVLPESVTQIKERAFYRTECLKSVVFSENLEEIGEYAFCESAISSVELPDSLKSIGSFAFQNCASLADVIIRGKTIISERAFNNTPWLDMNDDEWLIVGDGCLLKANHKPDGDTAVIPDGVKYIEATSLFSSSNITTVIFPKSVIEIGSESFAEISKLENVVLPENLKKIGRSAFKGTSINAIEFPSSLEAIGEYAFCDTYLTEITLPEGIKILGTLGNSPFDCDLKELVIPSSVEVLGISPESITNGMVYKLAADCKAMDFFSNYISLGIGYEIGADITAKIENA